MNNVKSQFSIKDLENLSGIKAHTIRIWEKRYNLFQPNRTETNIRYYNLDSLQKLLNISYLNNNGYKISKISKLTNNEIPELVKEIASVNEINDHAINAFKLSMLNFDQSIFHTTFQELEKKLSFKDIFHDAFVPFLNQIGLLWQTNTITPAHEHFIFELIKQKIIIHTDRSNRTSKKIDTHKSFVLFLPDNEIHELGLLYTNYELNDRGFHSIYLGQSVPIDSLEFLLSQYKNITFISSFTVTPEKDEIENYIKEFTKKLLKDKNNILLVSGRLTQFINPSKTSEQIKIFNTTKEILEAI